MKMEWMPNACVCCLLLWNAVWDWRKREICLCSLGLFALSGIGLQMVCPWGAPEQIPGGMIVGGGMILLSLLSKGAIGTGDGLLLCVTGIYLGFYRNLELILGALFLCFVVTAVLWICGNVHRKTEIPFVPFLFAACLIEVILW